MTQRNFLPSSEDQSNVVDASQQPVEEQAFTLLKKAFSGWDFVSKDVAYAKTKVNLADPKHEVIPIFRIVGASSNIWIDMIPEDSEWDTLSAEERDERSWKLREKAVIKIAFALSAMGANLNISHFKHPYKSQKTYMHDFNQNNRAPLHYYLREATMYYREEIVKWLLENNADINAREDNEYKLTPLMLVCSENSISSLDDILPRLLQGNADPMIRNAARQNAISYVASLPSYEVVKVDIMIESVISRAIQAYSHLKKEGISQVHLDSLGRLTELERMTRINAVISAAYVRACKKFIKYALEQDKADDLELILEYLEEKHYETVLSDISNPSEKETFQSFAERHKYFYEDYISCDFASDKVDLHRLAGLINRYKSHPLFYKYINIALKVSKPLSAALILEQCNDMITDNHKEDLLYQSMRYGKISEMAIFLLSIPENRWFEFRGYLFDYMQRDKATDRAYINNFSDAISIYEKAMLKAKQLVNLMQAQQTTLFKAVMMDYLGAEYKPCISDETSLFIAGCANFLLDKSKEFRDKSRLESDRNKVQELIESESVVLNNLVSFFPSLKNKAKHKIAKRKLIAKGSLVDEIILSSLPVSLEQLTGRMYVESKEFDRDQLINELKSLYAHEDLKPIFDMTAHGVNKSTKFNIVFLSEANLKNYSASDSDSGNTITGQYNGRNSVIVAGACKHSHAVYGTLIHELGHYMETKLNNNQAKPYKINESHDFISRAISETMKLIYDKLAMVFDDSKTTFELGKAASDTYAKVGYKMKLNSDEQAVLSIILSVYSSYQESKEHIEIVVRYAELVAMKVSSTVINELIAPLADYHRQVTLKKAKEFLADSQVQDLRQRLTINREPLESKSISRMEEVLADELLHHSGSLSEKEIKTYIEKFIPNNIGKEFKYDESEKIHQRIKNIYGLEEIIKDPLMLMMAMHVLPYLENFYQTDNKATFESCVLRKDIFHMFTSLLFLDATEKVKSKYTLDKYGSYTLPELILTYSTSLAKLMLEHNLKEINETELFEENNVSLKPFRKYFSNSYDQRLFMRGEVYKAFQIGKTGAVLLSCKGGPGKSIYSFIHPEFLNYFGSLLPQCIKGRRAEIEAFISNKKNIYKGKPVLTSLTSVKF